MKLSWTQEMFVGLSLSSHVKDFAAAFLTLITQGELRREFKVLARWIGFIVLKFALLFQHNS